MKDWFTRFYTAVGWFDPTLWAPGWFDRTLGPVQNATVDAKAETLATSTVAETLAIAVDAKAETGATAAAALTITTTVDAKAETSADAVAALAIDATVDASAETVADATVGEGINVAVAAAAETSAGATAGLTIDCTVSASAECGASGTAAHRRLGGFYRWRDPVRVPVKPPVPLPVYATPFVVPAGRRAKRAKAVETPTPERHVPLQEVPTFSTRGVKVEVVARKSPLAAALAAPRDMALERENHRRAALLIAEVVALLETEEEYV